MQRKKKSKREIQEGNNNLFYRYIKYQRNGKERNEKTIIKIEYAWGYWTELMNGVDLKKRLTQETIMEFKDKLRNTEKNGKGLGPGTRYDILRHVRDVFSWISLQPGYRSKVVESDLICFKANDEERCYRYCRDIVEYPSLEQILTVCKSIVINSIIDLRDRAIIAFLYVSAARIDAAASVPMCCFNPKSVIVNQNPKKGMRTKFSKQFPTVLFPHDDYLINIVLEWYNTLKTGNFGSRDPMFPQAEPTRDGYSYAKSISLSHNPLTASGMRGIIKKRFLAAGLEYYYPHTFRHGSINEAMDRAEGPQELKAISQNIGHEMVNYIINTYGQLSDRTLASCISNLKRKA